MIPVIEPVLLILHYFAWGFRSEKKKVISFQYKK